MTDQRTSTRVADRSRSTLPSRDATTTALERSANTGVAHIEELS
jgi:hypothetical protein